MKLKVLLRTALAALFFFLIAYGTSRMNPVVLADESEVTPDNGLPVVYLNIDETQGTIEEMLESPDHSVYCQGSFSIDVPEGFHYSDFADLECESVSDLAMSIRGRGNTTWSKNKKPFKIKLDKKTDVFGLGKNKHWVLIANATDASLIRDRITAWLGDQFGFEFTPRGVPVDVVMSGEIYGTHYLGSYYLSENVRVDTNRLEIDELEETDTELPEISGGYLLQNALQVREGSPDRFYTSRGVDWATHTPSFDTEENALFSSQSDDSPLQEELSLAVPELEDAYENPVQQEYIQNHIQMIEDVLYQGGTAYREYFDVESAAKYWLMNTLSMNTDGYATGSTYIYKKRDADGATGRLYWGPLWDYDYAWDFSSVTEGMYTGHEWLKPMFCDREEGGFVEEVRSQWPVLKDAALALIAEDGVIDQYYEETKRSALADRLIRYPDDTGYDYAAKVEKLKNWIRRRVQWIDENIDMIDTLAHQVRLICDDSVYELIFANNGEPVDLSIRRPEKEGYVFTGWMDENGTVYTETVPADSDMTLTAQFIAEEDAVFAHDIAMRKDCDIVQYNFRVSMYHIDYSVVPADADEKTVEWTSSDESYASVDSNGNVTYSGPGQVTLTAKLKNGAIRTFTLTVTEDEIQAPESIEPQQDEIQMDVSEQTPVYIRTVPSPARLNAYEYISADENVVSVDEYGILKAVGPGETQVTVRAYYGEAWEEQTVYETVVTVIVSEEDPAPGPDDEPQPAAPVYTVTQDGPFTYIKGSQKDLTVTVKRSEADETCFSHFTSVLIDSKQLKNGTDYTAAKGSTIITLKASYLETLKAEDHTVTILFDDAEAETSIRIVNENKPAPDTSDQGSDSLYAVLCGSLICFLLALIFRIRAA